MMNKMKITLVLVAAAFLIVLSGCDKVPFMNEEPPAPPSHSHFDDVLIPSEMSVDRDNSFVFETQGFKAGTLYFKGRVDVDSLTDFFKNSMPKDGWRLKSIFRHPKTVLLFEKPDKNCIVMIYENTLFTYLEVWLAPQV